MSPMGASSSMLIPLKKSSLLTRITISLSLKYARKENEEVKNKRILYLYAIISKMFTILGIFSYKLFGSIVCVCVLWWW
jgi:hypothetical protein